ncbi:regulatory LuxR family protein [Micromonospora sp. Llam0]|uniref:helix-turn-helix transcriptional regulator n=1 Tax=Micromonospora sp. Llam0 TaxID=2485143 RepID=UPI000F9495FF|nr:LuxR C-terminal-related transcriptional regulator [Micromonospora sp. Llam0]ROO62927.1 regulatory LuxR family protein [Micromonospora sp. Llam0]
MTTTLPPLPDHPAHRAEPADRLLDLVLPGPVEPTTRTLLTAAAAGDPVLLRALVQLGLALGDLARRDGHWRWSTTGPRTAPPSGLSGTRPGAGTQPVRRTAGQLAAIRTLAESWSRPQSAAGCTFADRPGAAVPPVRLPRLTVREQEILRLLADGLTARAIGHRLLLSPRTVAKHQERMYRKFGTSDRLTTVLRAQRLGLLPPPDALAVTGRRDG